MKKVNNIFVGKSSDMPAKSQPNSIYIQTDKKEISVSSKSNFLKRIFKKEKIVLSELTPFMAGEIPGFPEETGGHACQAEMVSTFNTLLYHNGEGQYPVFNDKVYTDSLGTVPRTQDFAYFDGITTRGAHMSFDGTSLTYGCR